MFIIDGVWGNIFARHRLHPGKGIHDHLAYKKSVPGPCRSGCEGAPHGRKYVPLAIVLRRVLQIQPWPTSHGRRVVVIEGEIRPADTQYYYGALRTRRGSSSSVRVTGSNRYAALRSSVSTAATTVWFRSHRRAEQPVPPPRLRSIVSVQARRDRLDLQRAAGQCNNTLRTRAQRAVHATTREPCVCVPCTPFYRPPSRRHRAACDHTCHGEYRTPGLFSFDGDSVSARVRYRVCT